jgi:hypothetical protein
VFAMERGEKKSKKKGEKDFREGRAKLRDWMVQGLVRVSNSR